MSNRGRTVADDVRVTAIRERNLAFDRLQQATLACERKRHTMGSLPPQWAARLRELQQAYNLALAACANWRC
jgi:hypothetical protein